MYFVGLHGHGTSSAGRARAARPPSAGSARTGRPPRSNRGSTAAPIRVMMLHGGDHVLGVGDLHAEHRVLGVQRAHAERNDVHRAPVHGPADTAPTSWTSFPSDRPSCWSDRRRPAAELQMNVRSSTRATSSGSETAQNELGFFSSLSRRKVPAFTRSVVTRSHSASEPSHHTTRSGSMSSAVSRTQVSRRALLVGASSIPGTVATVMCPRSTAARPRGMLRTPGLCDRTGCA